jgi:hypothetical protein
MRRLDSSTTIVLYASLAVCGLVGCASSRQPSSAQLTSAGSPELRTVDNAGYVDPGGRTRQVSAGSAPAPVGRGNGIAPTLPESATQSSGATEESSAGLPERASPIAAPADSSELHERASRALCDREVYCERLGAGRPYESQDACMTDKRVRVRRALDRAPCTEFRGDRVTACLGAIRAAPCGRPDEPIPPPSSCTKDVLCAER